MHIHGQGLCQPALVSGGFLLCKGREPLPAHAELPSGFHPRPSMVGHRPRAQGRQGPEVTFPSSPPRTRR